MIAPKKSKTLNSSMGGTMTSHGSSARSPQPPPQLSATAAAGRRPNQQSEISTVFRQLRGLLLDPGTSQQLERHVSETNAALALLGGGGLFPAVALDGVSQVIASFCQSIEQSPSTTAILVPPLTALIDTAAMPLTCVTLDDQRKYEAATTSLLESIALALRLPVVALRITAAVALRQIFACIRQQCYDDLHPPPAYALEEKLREYWKGITPSVVHSLTAAWLSVLERTEAQEAENRHVDAEAKSRRQGACTGDDEDEDAEAFNASSAGAAATPTSPAELTLTAAPEVIVVLKAVLEVSAYRTTCGFLRELGAASLACRTMSLCTAGDRRLTLCMELLWNMLILDSSVAAACATAENIQTLYEVFVGVLACGFKQKERELRNDMILVVRLIAECEDSMPLLVPFTDLLLELSCGHEKDAGSNPHINAKFHHTTHHEDLQMKVLCWTYVEHMCSMNASYAEAILQWGFVDILLRYIDVNCEQQAVVRWSTDQLMDLQDVVLNILESLCPIAVEFYIHDNAIRVLHDYIHECPDKILRNSAVSVLSAIARTPMRGHLVDAQAIPLALNLLRERQDDHGLRVDALELIADVVDRDPQLQREFLDCGGIPTVLPLLTFNPQAYTDLRETVIFAGIDCLWSCVAESTGSIAEFVRHDGIHCLLCVVESCQPTMRPFPLAALSDVLASQAAVREFRAWVSPTSGLTATQLLLSLWSTGTSVELARSNATVSGLETIGASSSNVQRFSMDGSGAGQATQDPAAAAPAAGAHNERTILRRGFSEISPDIAGLVAENTLRFKIYSCLSRVSFADHKELDVTERAKLAAVAAFVELCQDEVWNTVSAAVVEHGLEPITSDATRLRQLREAAELRSSALLKTVATFDDKRREQELEAEATFYKTLIKRKDEKVQTTKGTNMSITEAKIRKAQMLKASFKAALTTKQAAAHADSSVSAQPAQPAMPTGGSQVVAEVQKKQAGERWGLGQRALTDTEYLLLQAVNKVRTDPRSLIPAINKKLECLNAEGNAFVYPDKQDVENCVEGAAPYQELLETIESMRPIVTLLDVPMGMLLAARDHTNDLARRMEITQEGSDNSTPQMRLNRYGRVGNKSSQLLSIGMAEVQDMVLQLLSDDGIPTRVDRKALLDPDARVCGISIGKHSIHETVAVIVLAHEYSDKTPQEQREIHLKFNKPTDVAKK